MKRGAKSGKWQVKVVVPEDEGWKEGKTKRSKIKIGRKREE